MKIALDLDVQLKEGMLILNSASGRTLIFPKDHVVPKKIQMVTLAELSDLTIEHTALMRYQGQSSTVPVPSASLRTGKLRRTSKVPRMGSPSITTAELNGL